MRRHGRRCFRRRVDHKDLATRPHPTRLCARQNGAKRGPCRADVTCTVARRPSFYRAVRAVLHSLLSLVTVTRQWALSTHNMFAQRCRCSHVFPFSWPTAPLSRSLDPSRSLRRCARRSMCASRCPPLPCLALWFSLPCLTRCGSFSVSLSVFFSFSSPLLSLCLVSSFSSPLVAACAAPHRADRRVGAQRPSAFVDKRLRGHDALLRMAAMRVPPWTRQRQTPNAERARTGRRESIAAAARDDAGRRGTGLEGLV